MVGSTLISRRRIRTLQRSADALGLKCFISTVPSNIKYLTANHRFDYTPLLLVVPVDSDPILYVQIMGLLRTEKVGCAYVEPLKKGEQLEKKVSEQISIIKMGKLGFDELPFKSFQKIRRKLKGTSLVHKPDLLAEMRQVKDLTEIDNLREAARLADIGMDAAMEALRVGVREYEVVAEAEYAMRRRGSEGTPFRAIVASGHRSVLPHGEASERKIQKGETVVVDIGANFKGYCSDSSRTVFIGKPSEIQCDVYRLVKEAQEIALTCIHKGMTGIAADNLAREIIKCRKYGDYFIHGLGHGIGLDVHETPKLASASRDRLMKGNVITIEPGIYLPNRFGVRIEDMALVTNRGLKLLTHSYKEDY